MKKTLLIRADANATIGHGHVMRMLAIAQEWIAIGNEVVFLAKELPYGLKRRLSSAGCDICEMSEAVVPGSDQDACLTENTAVRVGAHAIFLDGYGFGESFCRLLRNQGKYLLAVMVDSMPQEALINLVNLVVYPGFESVPDEEGLERESFEKLLSGPDYILLREEFLEAVKRLRKTDSRSADGVDGNGENHLLISLGGADPNNVTSLILKSIGKVFPGLDHLPCIRVLLGGSNSHLESVETQVEALRDRHQLNVQILQDVEDMPALLQGTDRLICSASGIVWEAKLMNVALAVVAIADNQLELYQHLVNSKFATGLGVCHETTEVSDTDSPLNEDKLSQFLSVGALNKSFSLTNSASQGPDGKGVSRVCDYLLQRIAHL